MKFSVLTIVPAILLLTLSLSRCEEGFGTDLATAANVSFGGALEPTANNDVTTDDFAIDSVKVLLKKISLRTAASEDSADIETESIRDGAVVPDCPGR